MKAWNHFWFEFHHPWALSLARVQVALVMLYLYGYRQFESMNAFSKDGLVPRELALSIFPETFRPPFAWFSFWGDSSAGLVHGVFLFLLVLILFGVGTRWIGWLAWVLHMGFVQRNFSILFGADVIAGLSLFYLSFTLCDEHLSLRSFFKTRPSRSDFVSSAFTRLWQIQILVIYAYTGFEKLKGNSWWDGTALWTVLGNPQMVGRDLSFLRHFPLLIVAMSFLTILFEVYFPMAMWTQKLRKPWLVAGLFFHSGIGLLMGLWTFSLLMLAPYWFFLTREELGSLISRFRRPLLSHLGS